MISTERRLICGCVEERRIVEYPAGDESYLNNTGEILNSICEVEELEDGTIVAIGYWEEKTPCDLHR